MGGPFANVSFLYDPRTQALVQYVKLPTGHKFCIYDPQTATRRAQVTENRSINEVKVGTNHALVLLALIFRKRLLKWGKKLLKLAGDKDEQANIKQQINDAGENVAQHIDRFFKNPPAAIGSLVVTAVSLPFRVASLVTTGIVHTVVPEEPDSPTGVPPKKTKRDVQAITPDELQEAFGGMPGGSAAASQAAGGPAGVPKGAAGLEEFARKMQEGMRNAGWFQPAGAKPAAAGQLPGGAASKEEGAGEKAGASKAGPSVGSAEGLQEYLAHLMRQGMFGAPVMLPDPDLDMDPDPDFGEGPMMDDPDPDFDLDEDEEEYEEVY